MSVEMILWAADQKVFEIAKSGEQFLGELFSGFGISLGKFVVLNAERPIIEKSLTGPGQVLDVEREQEKTQKAVALEHGENPIPILTAKGDAEVAEAIIAEAEKQGVFIAEDKRLVSLLSQVELNEEIPENLYVSVVAILSWVYWLKGIRPEDNKDI